MPAENYKKLTIAVIVILAVAIVIFAVTTSERKKEIPADTGAQRSTIPPGPLTDSTGQIPMERMEDLPDNPEQLAILGDRFFEAGKYDMAVRVYEKVLKLKPDDADTYNDMGLALHYLGKSDSALETLKKGTQVMPSYQRVWLSLGFVLMSNGKNDEAKKALKKAAELNPATDMGQEATRMLSQIK
jgi:tetratricopeptide (TPR) repeat protein